MGDHVDRVYGCYNIGVIPVVRIVLGMCELVVVDGVPLCGGEEGRWTGWWFKVVAVLTQAEPSDGVTGVVCIRTPVSN